MFAATGSRDRGADIHDDTHGWLDDNDEVILGVTSSFFFFPYPACASSRSACSDFRRSALKVRSLPSTCEGEETV